MCVRLPLCVSYSSVFPFAVQLLVHVPGKQILDMEDVFRGEFREELMCIMHFQILVLLSAEARLQREVGVSRLWYCHFSWRHHSTMRDYKSET